MFTKFENAIYNIIRSKAKRNLFLFLTFFLFGFSIWMITSENVLAKMLPGKDNNTFSVYVKTKTGSSLEETKKVVECVVENTIDHQEILNVETFIGRAGPLDFAGLIKEKGFMNHQNNAEVVINLTNKHHRDVPSFNIVQSLRTTVLENCSGLSENTNIAFVEPPAGPPVLASIVAEVYSTNPKNIEEISKIVEETFQETEGLVDIDTLTDDVYKTYDLEVNYDKATKSGIGIEQINKILYMSFEGMVLGVKNSVKNKKQNPIFLRYDSGKTFKGTSLENVREKMKEIKLMNNQGRLVPLLSIVSVKETMSNPIITNKNLKEMVSVVAETDMVSQVYPLMDARKAIISKVSPNWEVNKIHLFDIELVNKTTNEKVTILWDGEMKVTLDTFRDLGIAFIAALVFIFLLMVVYYKSFVLSVIVLAGSFLSIIGVILGHWVMDVFTTNTFFLTATSLIGFIALIGISSRNSLLLIDFAKHLHTERACDYDTSIAHATAVRAKPIFLTAAAIILASTLLASDAVFGGLGVALIFGTVTAVVASLIVVPILLSMSNLDKHFNK